MIGKEQGITVVPAAASYFVIAAPPSVSGGVPFSVTVSAKDPYKNVATGYTGTVHFTSSDAQAGLPADYTFTAADAGVHVFSVTLESNGSQSIAATDTSNTSITGQLGAIQVDGATQFERFRVAHNRHSGQPGAGHRHVLDASDNVVSGYAGTVQFTSTDTQAVLPADYTFTAADAGPYLQRHPHQRRGNG